MEIMQWCLLFICISRYIDIDVVKPVSGNFNLIIFYKTNWNLKIAIAPYKSQTSIKLPSIIFLQLWLIIGMAKTDPYIRFFYNILIAISRISQR